jgi:Uri superfamily endonuclease
VFRLTEPHTLTAGRLGAFDLSPGVYVYVGSALGPGGLRARVARHLRAEKRPHWHVDALTTIAPVVGVWWTVSPVRMECEWAWALANLPGVTIPIPRFGASDCRCPGHLLGMGKSPHSPQNSELSKTENRASLRLI